MLSQVVVKVAVLKLVQEGVLDLDAPLERSPEFAPLGSVHTRRNPIHAHMEIGEFGMGWFAPAVVRTAPRKTFHRRPKKT